MKERASEGVNVFGEGGEVPSPAVRGSKTPLRSSHINHYFRGVIMKRIYLFLAILSLIAPAAGLNWTGAVSTAWHEPGNWSPATVPDASFGVTVPVVASGRYPLVSTTEAHCYSLVINSGASVTVGANDLNVALNASIFGTLNINSASEFWVGSGIIWQSGSTASITHSLAEIRCQSMEFPPCPPAPAFPR